MVELFQAGRGPGRTNGKWFDVGADEQILIALLWQSQSAGERARAAGEARRFHHSPVFKLSVNFHC